MRRLFLYLVILAGAVVVALYFHQQQGYILLAAGPWRIEMSLLFFAVLLGLALLLLFLALRLGGKLLSVPGTLLGWRKRRRYEAARTELNSGLLRFTEGDFASAEQQLMRSARRSEAPLVNYLTAAMAAQRRGSREARDRHLSVAEEECPHSRVAVHLLQAQLQSEAGQWEEAQATLNALLDEEPRHRRALELMVSCCRALGDWERLEALLPRIERQGIVPKSEQQELNRWVARERLARAAGEGANALEKAWSDLSRPVRRDPDVIGVYADGLITQGREAEAEELIRRQLQKSWDIGLLRRFATLPAASEQGYLERLKQVEEWLKGRSDDPELLYVAGLLSLRAERWDQAREYLQAAVDQAARPEFVRALAALQERCGDYAAALGNYRLAMELAGPEGAVPDLPGLPQPGSAGGAATAPESADDSAPPAVEAEQPAEPAQAPTVAAPAQGEAEKEGARSGTEAGQQPSGTEGQPPSGRRSE